MRLLFVKLKHIGDALLLTPTLAAARANYPEARIWVVVREGTQGILAGCPAIDRILTAAAPEAATRSRLNWWQDWRLIQQLRHQRFNYAFELTDGDRGRWFTALSGAKVRCANDMGRGLSRWWRWRFNCLSRFDWLDRHRVEKDFYTVNDALPLKGDVPPLIFARDRTEAWAGGGELSQDYAVIHSGTRWKRKRWPSEKWIELGRFLLTRFRRLVISTGPDPEETLLGRDLQSALGNKALCTGGKTTWAQLAGLLYGARLFVGVDTAAMHLAAACQCPTVAIFGPSDANEWQPWKVACRIIEPLKAIKCSGAVPETWIHTISVKDVTAACDSLAG